MTTGTGATQELATAAKHGPSTRIVLVIGAVIALLLAGVVSAWASSHPDGLEFVAEKLGFADAAGAHVSDGSPLAGYSVQALGEGPLAGGLAGVIGVLVVALVMGLLVLLLRRSRGRS